jgi:putative hydrolase of the HAD superfamily
VPRRAILLDLVSNTTWGSPSVLWREEIARHGLIDFFDVVVFCRDVGWRKPARAIFEHTLAELAVSPDACLFVGDDPRWDVAGPRACGIEAILVDRAGTDSDPDLIGIPDLVGLHTRLP